jgi:glycosyltransferase involved in cell wall biosynthesis
MNILNLAPFNVWDLGYGKGRVSTYLPLRGLVDRGHKVWWLTSAEQVAEGDDARLKRDGIEVLRFKVPFLTSKSRGLGIALSKTHSWVFMLVCVARGYMLARRIKPDLIYANQLIAAFPAFLLSRILRVPYVVRSYGFHYLSKVVRPLYWGTLAFKLPADLYILVNDGTSGDKIVRSFGVPDEKIAFLVNGIDKDLPSKADRSFRDKLAPHGEDVVLCAYRLVPSKQIHLLIEAIPAVTRQNSNVLFVIVGDGPERPRLVSLCEDLGVSRFVRFEGATPNSVIPSYLGAADLVISLNAASSISNSVLEAMCLGKAVIALNTGTTSDLITHLENGFLLEADGIHKLAEAIVSLLDDERLCGSLGRSARDFMLEHWPSWEERVAQEVQLVEGVVERHGRAARRGNRQVGKPTR